MTNNSALSHEECTDRRVRLVLVEDESLLRELLQIALSKQLGLQVTGTFADGSSLLANVPALQLDVALIDIELGRGPNGVQVGLQLRREIPSVGIVLLSNHSDLRYLDAIPRDEICGWSYLLKKSVQNLDALHRAIAGAASGFVVLDPVLVHQPSLTSPKSRFNQISSRLRCLWQLIAEGYTNAAIAEKLHLSPKTVENQINLLYQELGIDRADRSLQPRVQAVLAYLNREQVSPADGDDATRPGPWPWDRAPSA